MYDENMLIDLEGEDYGEPIIRTVSEPDSYFPRSLTLYDDIVSANIVATSLNDEDKNNSFIFTPY